MNNSKPRIGIIGEGKMGTGLFYLITEAGYPVTWIVSESADLEKLRKNFLKRIRRALDSGVIDETTFSSRQENALTSNQISDLDSCGLIIEAIPEDLHLKKELFRKIIPVVKKDCILASNSSSILPSRIITDEENRKRSAGLHFFYPVQLKNIVEFITMDETTNETIDFIGRFLEGINRDHLQLDEKNAFILNRIFLEFQNEAYSIVIGGGSTIPEIDAVIREHFFPHGAFDIMDSVGIQTMLASVLNYTSDHPNRIRFLPLVEKLGQLEALGTCFYAVHGNDQRDPGGTNHALIIARLSDALKDAVNTFRERSGISQEKLLSALNEYFGTDISGILRN